MQMIAIGVDIIELARINKGIDRYGSKFLDRIFTVQEQVYCAGRMERLAARFAIKEAVGKALGTGIGDIGWKDIEVVNDERGRPELILHNAAAELAEVLALRQWSISMSHTRTYAVGMVVATGSD